MTWSLLIYNLFVQLGMPVVREVCVQWLVEIAECISQNPQFIVSSFVCSGIFVAIDGTEFSVTEDSSDVVDAKNTGDSDSELRVRCTR